MGCHPGTGRAQRWHLAVTCKVTLAIITEDECNCGVFVISEHTILFVGLCNINKWQRGHRSHIMARFRRNFVCQVTYLPISQKQIPRFELSYHGKLQQPVEFKIVRTEKYLRTEPPSRTCPLLQISLKFVSNGQNGDNSVLGRLWPWA